MGKWGRPGQGMSIIKDLQERGYIKVGDRYYPPNSFEAKTASKIKVKRSKIIKTGWIDDSRNLKNKEKYRDPFIQFLENEIQCDVWPEFFFSTDRLYRFDYALPKWKIAIEVNGGVWAKGHSGHSSGKGIMRDYEKSNLAQSLGWKVLTVIPAQVKNYEVLYMIKKMI